MSSRNLILSALLLLFANGATAAALPWSADRGDGTYRNPVIFADYSDPDVIAVGDDFYLVASSFQSGAGSADPALARSRELDERRLCGRSPSVARLRSAAARQRDLGAEPSTSRRIFLDLRGRSRPRHFHDARPRSARSVGTANARERSEGLDRSLPSLG